MANEELNTQPAEQELKEEELQEVNGGGSFRRYELLNQTSEARAVKLTAGQTPEQR